LADFYHCGKKNATRAWLTTGKKTQQDEMSAGAFREARRDGDHCFLGITGREEEGGGTVG